MKIWKRNAVAATVLVLICAGVYLNWASKRDAIPELTEEDEKLLIRYHQEGMLCGHACMGETTYMMGITPENVHLDRLGIESGLPQPDPVQKLADAGIITDSYGWFRTFPNWYEGHDPIGCNERMGKAALRLESERIAKAFKIYKEDTVILQRMRDIYKDPSMLD